MRIQRIAAEGLHALTTHKLRTFFMMAGTIVGIAALTVIMAVGKGTERQVMRRVENFGPRAMMVIAGGGRDMPPPDMTVTTLTLDDAEAIRSEIDGLELVSPQAWQFGVDLRHEANQTRATVWGIEPSWHQAWDWYASEGEEIDDADVATLSRVCLVGTAVQRDLFDGENPVGQSLYVNNVSLTVKGVLEHRGAGAGGGEFDNRIVIPITTAMRRVMNVDHLGAIRVITADAEAMPQQAEAIRELLRARHRITPPDEDDFRIISPIAIATMVRGTSRTLAMLLGALAGLSLLVGGVVLMNILLISVSERTAEIGLRRAVGATRGDIFTQFLAESLCVTLLGMILGSALGAAVAVAVGRFSPLPAVISPEPFLLAVAFALAVGIFFGVQPARRAAKLHPVDALR